MTVLDLFAGPGGWSEGLRSLGIDELGIESDQWTCRTRDAAGHETLQADVTALDPSTFDDVAGLIASPPCPAFSSAGKREGSRDIPNLLAHIVACGQDGWVPAVGPWEHPESPLTLEPLRWALAITPRWIVCEQVRQVLPIWKQTARALELNGYATWAGILNAADYGVPQTRLRAFLIASRERDRVGGPTATHYDPRRGGGLFGTPWVTMAEALGWEGAVGFPRRDDRGTSEDGYRERRLVRNRSAGRKRDGESAVLGAARSRPRARR